MRNIKLTIEYDGTDFNGWQIQAKRNRTVQGEIEKALQKILNKKTRICGSGRTDSGVHALGQVANFRTTATIPCDGLHRALNTYLPDDISILTAKEVPLTFHAQFNAKRKTYRYTILNRREPCAINRRYYTHINYQLNINRMRAAAKFLIGKHDFKCFVASNPAKRGKKESTMRQIYRAEIKKHKDFVVFEIESNGFLYKMVRNIIGTLIDIGVRNHPATAMHDILKSKNRTNAGDTAPPQGLCLYKVSY